MPAVVDAVPVLPCVIGRNKVFLEQWLRLLLLATHSLNIIHGHRLLHETWLRLHKIARERHHLLREMSREVARLLHVRHELIRLCGIHVRIEHVRHVAWLHLHHRSRQRSSLESDMGSSIRGGTILKSRRPEYHALAVALTVTFRLDAIFAYRSLFATLDTAFTTSQTSGFGSLAESLALRAASALVVSVPSRGACGRCHRRTRQVRRRHPFG